MFAKRRIRLPRLARTLSQLEPNRQLSCCSPLRWLTCARHRFPISLFLFCYHHGAFQSLELVQRLVVFPRGVGVVHYACASLKINGVICHNDGSYCDAGVHVTCVAEITYSTAVGSPLRALAFGDNLHSPDFGCAAERAGGESSPE